jgi:hypothetical protein
MTGYEQKMHEYILPGILKALERIADSLEKTEKEVPQEDQHERPEFTEKNIRESFNDGHRSAENRFKPKVSSYKKRVQQLEQENKELRKKLNLQY